MNFKNDNDELINARINLDKVVTEYKNKEKKQKQIEKEMNQ